MTCGVSLLRRRMQGQSVGEALPREIANRRLHGPMISRPGHVVQQFTAGVVQAAKDFNIMSMVEYMHSFIKLRVRALWPVWKYVVSP